MTLERLASSSGRVPVGRATARGERARRAREIVEAKEGMVFLAERGEVVVDLRGGSKGEESNDFLPEVSCEGLG